MNKIGLFLVCSIQWSLCFLMIQGQCDSSGTCVCHCEDCTSGCSTCLPGWSGSFTNYCQKSNTFYQFYGKASENTTLLDGDFDTYVEDNSIPPYVRIEFQTTVEFRHVDITLEFAEKIFYTVYVKHDPYRRADSMICSNFTSGDVSIKKTVTVTCNTPLHGRFIEIVASNLASLPTTTLKVFEIERFECSNGTYGESCSGICSAGCNKQCDKETGDCVCKSGYWGSFCNRTCPLHCNKNLCNSNTGECYSCNHGYYGVKCQSTCSVGCLETCNMTSGLCVCKPGFYSADCTLQCQLNCAQNECLQETGHCISCNEGRYGDFCDFECFGYCIGSCNKRDGICGICAKHKFGTYCNQTCPNYCEEGICNRVTGECETCLNNTYGLYCDQTCPVNCETGNRNGDKCTKCIPGRYGEYCTELCSRTCKNLTCFSNQSCVYGCEDGFFGNYCDSPCSAAVPSCNQCELVNNVPVCQRCADPLYLEGSTCSECPENCLSCSSSVKCLECKTKRFYGDTCNITCNKYCLNRTCDITGQCVHGCDDGKYGSRCDKDCPSGCRTCHNSSVCLEGENGQFEGL